MEVLGLLMDFQGLSSISTVQINNNESTTVLSCFRDGVQQYGLTLRVRGDQGRENVKVCTRFIRIHHVQL